jgi:hypothetical protein
LRRGVRPRERDEAFKSLDLPRVFRLTRRTREHGRRRRGRRGIRPRGQIRGGVQAVSWTKSTPSARSVATRASGRACALSGGDDLAAGCVVHSDMLLRHRAISARALRNEPSETRAHPLEARALRISPIDGTLEGTTLVLVEIASSSVKIDVASAELQFVTHYGTVLPGPAL